MESLDVRVWRQLLEWRRAGIPALLTTVISTWGSSPRPEGSIMAISATGSVVGSVSGGCIEDDLHCRYNADPTPRKPSLVRYGVSADEAHRFGLPCGGTVELLLEYDIDVASLESLVGMLSERHLVRRTVQISSGEVELQKCKEPAGLLCNKDAMSSTFGPEYRMLIIGAGQLTEYLCTMATFSGFRVTVCDPRIEYTQSWGLSDVEVLSGMPDDVVMAFGADRRTCIVALSHDPKLDDLALLEALRSPAFYVGAIGSRKNQESRVERLREHFEMTDDEAQGLRGPIGIYLGSKTPAEIAVSVMAEILAVKNGVELPSAMRVADAKRHREKILN